MCQPPYRPGGRHMPRAETLDQLVRCRTGSIDRNKHKGRIGEVSGFARLSHHHAREASVTFADGAAAWFWESDLEIVTDEIAFT